MVAPIPNPTAYARLVDFTGSTVVGGRSSPVQTSSHKPATPTVPAEHTSLSRSQEAVMQTMVASSIALLVLEILLQTLSTTQPFKSLVP